MKRLWIALTVVSVAGAATAAQNPQTTFQSTIELVRVDAVVVDKDGKAVRGLTQADFALTDRKKPQKVATFEEISHERGRAGAGGSTSGSPAFPTTLRMDVASNVAMQADRVVIVVVDDLHIWQGRTDKTKELAREVITKLGDHASMSLLFTSTVRSTQMIQDRSSLLAAVDAMKARQSFRRPHQAIDFQKAQYVDPEAPVEYKFEAIDTAQKTSLQDFEENLQWFKTLEDASAMLLAEDQRRKSFVMISEGLNRDLSDVFASSGALSEMGAPDRSTGLPHYDFHKEAMRNMMDAMRKSGVAMYALDPRGKIEPQDIMLESWPPLTCAVCSNPPALPGPGDAPRQLDDRIDRFHNPVRVSQGALVTMAEASGGFAITDTSDLSNGIDRILEDIDHYYLLGFYPADPNGGRYRALQVTVPGHPEYTIRARQGYQPGAATAPVKNKDPLVELSAGVLPKSDLPLRLTAVPLVGTGPLASVAVALEITAPTGLMKDADEKLRDDVTYSVLVVDDKKEKVTSRTGRSAKLSLVGRNDAGDMPDSVTYQIPLMLDLAPGRYQLRASAISTRLNKGGSVYLDVTVPDFAKVPLALSGIALGYSDGAHVPVGKAAPDRVPFDPTLSREFKETDTLRAYFEVARQDAASTVSLAIALIDMAGKVCLTVDESVGPNESGKMDVPISLSLVGAGAFRLRVTATDQHATATTETGIVIK